MDRLPDNVVDIPAYRERIGIFLDRTDAGHRLAQLIGSTNAVLLAIPAGGVPVAAAMVEDMGVDLDALIVSKITMPWNTEAGFGAISADGTVRLNHDLLPRLPMSEADVEAQVAATRAHVERRERVFRGNRAPLDFANREVILVDDGLASGFTMKVALEAARKLGARSYSIAVPTAHVKAVRTIAPEVDRLYCANIRSGSTFAVASAYRKWRDVPEKEALALFQLRTEAGAS